MKLEDSHSSFDVLMQELRDATENGMQGVLGLSPGAHEPVVGPGRVSFGGIRNLPVR